MTITKEEEEIEGNEHVQDEKMEDALEVKGEEETANVEAKDIKNDEIVGKLFNVLKKNFKP